MNGRRRDRALRNFSHGKILNYKYFRLAYTISRRDSGSQGKLPDGRRDLLIAIAGADGAGKTTLSKKLSGVLQQRGINAIRLDRFDILNPELCPPCSFIKSDANALRQHALAMPSPARLLFLYWSMTLTISQQLDSGDPTRVVIFDSYWMKHTAAEIIYGADEAAAIAAIGLIPRPDVTFYVKLTAEQLLDRKNDNLTTYECGMDPTCGRNSFLTHQRRILALLDRWSRRFGWCEIDGTLAVDTQLATLSQQIQDTYTHRRARHSDIEYLV